MQRLSKQAYEDRLRELRLLITDVDGVLTDGSIVYAGADCEAKAFHVRDGSAFYIAAVIDLQIAVVTARESAAVARRFSELPVLELRQGAFDKVGACLDMQAQLGLEASQVAFLGDDLVDLAVMRHVGVGIAVADAHPRILEAADWVTTVAGGRGALREVVDDAVTARDLWSSVLQDYLRRQSVVPGADADAP